MVSAFAVYCVVFATGFGIYCYKQEMEDKDDNDKWGH